MRISDWSSDVCSSDLALIDHRARVAARRKDGGRVALRLRQREPHVGCRDGRLGTLDDPVAEDLHGRTRLSDIGERGNRAQLVGPLTDILVHLHQRSEEHTSELQSLMRISYSVFCLK